MKIFESLDIEEKFPNPVLTIGNYDGIHMGHRQIIEKVVEKSRALSGTSMLMSFNPHPLSVLRPDTYTRLITPLHLKKKLIEKCGIDVMIIIPFDDAFRQITPRTFIEDILVRRLAIKSLLVGYDFKFGDGGKGNTAMLREVSGEYGFDVEIIDAITLDGEKVGSNQIRGFIMNGEVEKAARFLERPHMIEGFVVHGEQRGRGMGFPTINIDTISELVPKNGVYMTEVKIDGKRMPAVTNIGFNPTFDGKKFLVETHILDFTGDLYGREVAIYFHGRIRDEMRFNGIDELKARIAADIAQARERLAKSNEPII